MTAFSELLQMMNASKEIAIQAPSDYRDVYLMLLTFFQVIHPVYLQDQNLEATAVVEGQALLQETLDKMFGREVAEGLVVQAMQRIPQFQPVAGDIEGNFSIGMPLAL